MSFTFRLSNQACAYFNGLLAVASWMMETEDPSRALFLMFIAAVQYGSLCFLKCFDYAQKHQLGYSKMNSKGVSSRSKHRSRGNFCCKSFFNFFRFKGRSGSKKANMEKIQELDSLSHGRIFSPPPEKVKFIHLIIYIVFLARGRKAENYALN